MTQLIQRQKKIDWEKFENLQSVEIYGYSQKSKPLKGFHKGNFTSLAVNYSDIVAFFSNNQFPLSIKKITIWLGGEYEDTLFIPSKISALHNLNYFSIGGDANLSFENCNLSNLIDLDTLIISSPVSNLKFLNGVNHLNYLGFWAPILPQFKSELDSLLPNTTKEGWCFLGTQTIMLWNGQNKFIEQLTIGDTLISYNFQTESIFPSIVESIDVHKKGNYIFGTLYEDELIASSEVFPYAQNNPIVRATINHPIPTTAGIQTFGTLKLGAHYYALNTEKIVETRTTQRITFEIQNEKVFNIKTSADNYFVGTVLFMEK